MKIITQVSCVLLITSFTPDKNESKDFLLAIIENLYSDASLVKSIEKDIIPKKRRVRKDILDNDGILKFEISDELVPYNDQIFRSKGSPISNTILDLDTLKYFNISRKEFKNQINELSQKSRLKIFFSRPYSNSMTAWILFSDNDWPYTFAEESYLGQIIQVLIIYDDDGTVKSLHFIPWRQ
ncbi:MAG: hypothetical protein ACPGLV_03405 [Bacteroidia bacterium]